MNTYKDIEALYTWGNLLPLPANEKQPVPAGFTGLSGKDVTDADKASWANREGNFALRLPNGVVGIDVDHYGDKKGADTLAELESTYGELPATYISSGRDNPMQSGIRFFTYTGDKLAGKAGLDIDIIQESHRYAVVFPSVVNNGSGQRSYRWYAPDGTACGLPPMLHELAELPAKWEEFLKAGASNYAGVRASAQTTGLFNVDMASDGREVCEATRSTVTNWINNFDKVSLGSHHDTMLAALHATVGTCSQGHPGYNYAIDKLREAWQNAGLGSSRDEEFERMLEGAVAKRAAEHKTYTPMVGDNHSCEHLLVKLPASITNGVVMQANNTTVMVKTDEDEETYKDTMDVELGELIEESDEEGSWVAELGRDDKGNVQKTYANTSLIMQNDPILRNLGINTMGGGLAWRKLPAWRLNSTDSYMRTSISITDSDIDRCYAILREYFGGMHNSLSQDACKEAINIYTSNHNFSPWEDFVNNLPEWDGVARISECIPTVEHNDYTRQALMNFFLGLMQRTYEPGSQVDSVLVLWGTQGARKTSWFKSIVPQEGFYSELDTIPGASANKDLLADCHKSVVVLFDEIDKLRRRDEQAALKAFITGRVDTWRSPYARVVETHPRRFIIGGTTNEETFLLDATGNRRYWPVEITGMIPSEYLTREYMDLLIAEARDRYRAGERLVFDLEFESLAEEVRKQSLHDPIGEAIESWLVEPVGGVPTYGGKEVDVDRISVNMLIEYVPELRNIDMLRDKVSVDRIAACMDRNPDYTRQKKATRVDGKLVKRWWELNTIGK